MKPSVDHLSDEQLSQIIGTEFDCRPEIDAHLSDCEHCQIRMNKLANETGIEEGLESVSSGSNVAGIELERYLLESTQRRCRQVTPIPNEQRWNHLLDEPTHPELLGRLGRYDIERVIGSGGMGVVFKAYDGDLHRPVAIKLLAPHLMSHATARARFTREARAAAAVVHDHVVGIYNVEGQAKHPYLVMQYVNGESLQQRLDRAGPLELCQILRISSQVADGLAAAHAQGIVHRDLKPANILLEFDVERVLLADFGLASAIDDIRLTSSGFLPGTPQYMSPEQAKGEPADFRSDLFSLGCVLYTMCSGYPPFQARSSYAVLRKIADQQPRCLRDCNPSIPVWLEEIILKLLAKDPDERWQTAAELRDLLLGCLSHVQKPSVVDLPKECRKTAATTTSRQIQSKLRIGLASFGVGVLVAVLIFVQGNWMAKPHSVTAPAMESVPPTSPGQLAEQQSGDCWGASDIDAPEIDKWLRKMEKESLMDWNDE